MESLKEIIDQLLPIVTTVVIVGAGTYIVHRLQKSLWRPHSLSHGMDILVKKEYNQLSELKVKRPLLVMSYKDEYNHSRDIYYCEDPKRFLVKKFIGFKEPSTEELVEIQNRVEKAKKAYKEKKSEELKKYVI